MGHPKPESVVAPVRGGTGSQSLAPPWSREQVRWLGRGYYVLRLAMDETSRWLLGGGFPWNDVFPHERTFKRPANDKGELIKQLKMNPWPVHLAAALDPAKWREQLSTWVEKDGVRKVYDTGHVTLWRVAKLPAELLPAQQFVVLDGHHSRRAQRGVGLKRMFGWLEPLGAPQLSVRSIDRAGWLGRWIEALLKAGELKQLGSPPPAEQWKMQSSLAFEVVQGSKRFWCELARPEKGEAVVDALTRLCKGKVFLKSSASFDEILGWLERAELDTGLRLPPPTKEYVLERALARELFPQKATYFYPKVPFGILVEDLK